MERDLPERYEQVIRNMLGLSNRQSHRKFNPVFDDLLDEAIAVTRADMGNVQLFHASTSLLRIAASRGFDAAFLLYFGVVDGSSHCACGAALRNADRIVVPDIEQSPIFAGNESGEVLRYAGVRAVQSTPIVASDGKLMGVISTHWHTARVPGTDELNRLDAAISRAVGQIEAASAAQ